MWKQLLYHAIKLKAKLSPYNWVPDFLSWANLTQNNLYGSYTKTWLVIDSGQN